MKRYLKQYIEKIDAYLKENKEVEASIIEEHLLKIKWFQHERFIHLIVTVFYALFVLLALGISLFSELFILVAVLLLLFLIPYVWHYFFLENHVQYLYKQYDQMIQKRKM